MERRIPEGTILINRNCFFMRNYGNENNTKIHECVHWWLHRDFFNLLKIINPNGSYISCEVDAELKNDCSFSDELSWMEWQACSLAPKIMIPKEMGITKFKECLDKVGMCNEDDLFPKHVRFDMAVDLFAEFFGVTKISAKIRLIEFGFYQAIGVYNFVNRKVQDAFYFKEGFLKPGQTFIVDPQNAAIESLLNSDLRERVLNEEVLYINNVFVLNNEKYFGTYQNGKHFLTSYALDHMDECCLVFDSNIVSKKDPSYFNLCYLCNTLNISSSIEMKYSRQSKAELDENQIQLLRKKHEEEESFFRSLPSHPGRTIKAHLERKGMTYQQLADRSKIGKRMCDYYMSDYDVTNPDIFDVVALCIGMNLCANFSRDLLRKFGFDIDGKHDINYDSLRFIIENCHQHTIDSCNVILISLGCKKKIPSDSQSEKKKK